MADTSVEGGVPSILDGIEGLWGPYWNNENVSCIIFIESSSYDVEYSRTANAGSSWAESNLISGETFGQVRSLACWPDFQTPGDTGTLVHAVRYGEDAGGNSSIKYCTYDIDADSVGTVRTIESGTSLSGAIDNECFIAFTKTTSGDLIAAWRNSDNSSRDSYKSTNGGTSWSSISHPFEAASSKDYGLLFPANGTGDDDDACMIYWDATANEISIKMYDSSANSWTETSIATGMDDDPTHINMDGHVRLSDGHIILAAHSNDDNSSDDIKCWDINPNSISSPSVTALTDVIQNVSESAQVSVFIDQSNDDIYVGWLDGGTWQSSVLLKYRKSTDGGTSWSSDNTYGESSDDHRRLHAGAQRSDSKARYQPSFYDDDQSEIYVNLVNDIEIDAPGGSVPIFIHHQRFHNRAV